MVSPNTTPPIRSEVHTDALAEIRAAAERRDASASSRKRISKEGQTSSGRMNRIEVARRLVEEETERAGRANSADCHADFSAPPALGATRASGSHHSGCMDGSTSLLSLSEQSMSAQSAPVISEVHGVILDRHRKSKRRVGAEQKTRQRIEQAHLYLANDNARELDRKKDLEKDLEAFATVMSSAQRPRTSSRASERAAQVAINKGAEMAAAASEPTEEVLQSDEDSGEKRRSAGQENGARNASSSSSDSGSRFLQQVSRALSRCFRRHTSAIETPPTSSSL